MAFRVLHPIDARDEHLASVPFLTKQLSKDASRLSYDSFNLCAARRLWNEAFQRAGTHTANRSPTTTTQFTVGLLLELLCPLCNFRFCPCVSLHIAAF